MLLLVQSAENKHMFFTKITQRFSLPALQVFFVVATTATVIGLHSGVAHAATTWNVTPSSSCTLADAITASNTGAPSGSCAAGSNGGTINLSAGTYTLGASLPVIDSNALAINGAGSGTSTIDGQNTYGVIYDTNSAPLTLSNLTIARAGGSNQFAVLAYGPGTTVQNVVIRDSIAVGGIFLGIGTGNTDTVRNTAVINMHDLAGGGVTVNMSGGIANITNDTLYNDGRGVWVLANGGGTVNILNDTIANNNANGLPGGVGVQQVTSGTKVYVKSSILSNNTNNSVPANCGTSQSVSPGTLVAARNQGYNIVSDNTCAFVGATNKNSTDPLLGPLTFVNGTYVLPITMTSPAYDAADPTGAPSTDQRGMPRPQCYGVDSGAFEVAACGDPVYSILDSSGGSGGSSGSGSGNSGSSSGGGSSSAQSSNGGYYSGVGNGDPTTAGSATLQTQQNNPNGSGASTLFAPIIEPVANIARQVSEHPLVWLLLVIATSIFTTLAAGRSGFWLGRHRKLLQNRYIELHIRLHKIRLRVRRYFRNN